MYKYTHIRRYTPTRTPPNTYIIFWFHHFRCLLTYFTSTLSLPSSFFNPFFHFYLLVTSSFALYLYLPSTWRRRRRRRRRRRNTTYKWTFLPNEANNLIAKMINFCVCSNAIEFQNVKWQHVLCSNTIENGAETRRESCMVRFRRIEQAQNKWSLIMIFVGWISKLTTTKATVFLSLRIFACVHQFERSKKLDSSQNGQKSSHL